MDDGRGTPNFNNDIEENTSSSPNLYDYYSQQPYDILSGNIVFKTKIDKDKIKFFNSLARVK